MGSVTQHISAQGELAVERAIDLLLKTMQMKTSPLALSPLITRFSERALSSFIERTTADIIAVPFVHPQEVHRFQIRQKMWTAAISTECVRAAHLA